MSKNYTNYSKMTMPELVKEVEATVGLVETEEAKAITEEVMAQPALTIEEIAENAVAVEEATVEPEVAPPAEPKTGVVTANKLNIRKLPAPTAEVATIVDKNAKLMIDPEYETVEWIKVYTETGIEGYCMKKFVEVK